MACIIYYGFNNLKNIFLFILLHCLHISMYLCWIFCIKMCVLLRKSACLFRASGNYNVLARRQQFTCWGIHWVPQNMSYPKYPKIGGLTWCHIQNIIDNYWNDKSQMLRWIEFYSTQFESSSCEPREAEVSLSAQRGNLMCRASSAAGLLRR